MLNHDSVIWAAAALTIALAVALVFHVLWRLRYGYPPDSIPRVLCFHKLSRRFLFEGTWTTPARFAALIDRLRARGYTFIDEATYLAMLERPSARASKHVFVTFDDGYEETIDVAHEILSARGIPFHVFLVSDYAGKANTWDLSLGRPPVRHLPWERVRALSDLGVTFGSHTASHADVTRVEPAALLDDLARSRRAIEATTGKPVRTLSYPFGRCNARAQHAARAAGFEAAFSLYPPRRNAAVNRFALRRDAVYLIDPARAIERKLEPNVFYGLEEMKCRAINGIAVLTPLLKSWRRRA